MLQKGKHINSKCYRYKISHQVINHMKKKTGLPTSEQAAGCICFMTMSPHIELRKWETIWLSTRSRFCLTLPSAMTLHTVIFGYFLCLMEHMAEMKFTQCKVLAKEVQFTAQTGASVQVWEVLHKMDPKADRLMYRSWRRELWKAEIDIIWFMYKLNEIMTNWQKLLIHPRINCALPMKINLCSLSTQIINNGLINTQEFIIQLHGLDIICQLILFTKSRIP